MTARKLRVKQEGARDKRYPSRACPASRIHHLPANYEWSVD
jgi:hypothetical protein